MVEGIELQIVWPSFPMRVVSLIALTCTACGTTEKKAPTPGEVKAFASVCDKANDGKRIAVEGYLRLPEEVNRKIGPVLRLYPTPEFTAKPTAYQPKSVASQIR